MEGCSNIGNAYFSNPGDVADPLHENDPESLASSHGKLFHHEIQRMIREFEDSLLRKLTAHDSQRTEEIAAIHSRLGAAAAENSHLQAVLGGAVPEAVYNVDLDLCQPIYNVDVDLDDFRDPCTIMPQLQPMKLAQCDCEEASLQVVFQPEAIHVAPAPADSRPTLAPPPRLSGPLERPAPLNDAEDSFLLDMPDESVQSPTEEYHQMRKTGSDSTYALAATVTGAKTHDDVFSEHVEGNRSELKVSFRMGKHDSVYSDRVEGTDLETTRETDSLGPERKAESDSAAFSPRIDISKPVPVVPPAGQDEATMESLGTPSRKSALFARRGQRASWSRLTIGGESEDGHASGNLTPAASKLRSVRHSKEQSESEYLPTSNRATQRRPTERNKDSPLLDFWQNDIASNGILLYSRSSDLSHFQARSPSSRRSRPTTFADLFQSPTSAYRVSWELIGTTLLAFDWFYIPFVLLNPPWESLTRVTWMISIVYWALDVPSSFFEGYQQDGTLETRVTMTVIRYLKTWFVFDVTIVGLDIALYIVHLRSVPRQNLFRAFRGLRVLRIMKLLRILKRLGFFNHAFDLVTSEYARTLLKVMRNLMLVLMINHVFACFWFFIGMNEDMGEHFDYTLNYLPGEGWVVKILRDPTGRRKFDLYYFYFTALHWSLTQFTPASMEVTPTNLIERVYTVCVLVFAMVAFSTFISSITQAMTTMRIIAEERESRDQALRRYFRDQGVSSGLQMRVWRQIDAQQKKVKRRETWQDLPCLVDLPDILRIELQHDVYGRRLVGHPLFFYYNEISANAFRSICHHALQEFHLRGEDLLFAYAADAGHMYFLVWGNLTYHRFDEEKRREVNMGGMKKDEWCSENPLWIKWLHAGSMSATTDAIVMSLEVQEFLDVIRRYPDTHGTLKAYAEYFAAYVNENLFQGVTDLSFDTDELHDMVFSSFKTDDGDFRQELSGDFKRESSKRKDSEEPKTILGRISIALKWGSSRERLSMTTHEERRKRIQEKLKEGKSRSNSDFETRIDQRAIERFRAGCQTTTEFSQLAALQSTGSAVSADPNFRGSCVSR